jgi:transposase
VLHRRGIKTQLAKRRTPHGSGLGRTRWVVERTLTWLHRFRRLSLRYERPFLCARSVFDAWVFIDLLELS